MDDETTVQFRNPHKNNGSRHDDSFQPRDKEEDDEEEDDRWKKLFDKYWEKSSISGISFITSTKYTIVRIIWISLLLIACVSMTAHLVYLGDHYFSYEKQTKMDLEFKNLPFPAVTICNTNPFRTSQLQKASPRLRDVVYKFDPVNLLKAVRNWRSKTTAPDGPPSEPGGRVSEPRPLERKDEDSDSNFLDDFDINDFLTTMEGTSVDHAEAPGASAPSGPSGPSGTLNSGNGTVTTTTRQTTPAPVVTEDETFKKEFPDSWEAESSPSSFGVIMKYIRVLFTDEPTTIRQKMGHRIEDMLVQCSFNGRKCLHSHFVKDTSAGYGNCYTLENKKFIATNSGPRSGLELIFYLELEEYLRGITNAQGMQVVIHDPGTVPFPDDEGIAVSAGTNAFIGLKMSEIRRLGKPHGDCTPIDHFEETYGVRYTRQMCQSICLLEKIWADCRCYDGSTLMLNNLVNIPQNLLPCTAKGENNACMKRVKHLFKKRSKACRCDNPCLETQYRQIVSSRQWPATDFAKVIVEILCKQDPEGNRCQNLQKKDDEDLKYEFVRLNIFYEDLNYERIQESPDYERAQFLSDIGGTIGLWIGLSLLSLFEIFHLIVSVIITYFFPRWKASFSQKYKYRVNK